LLKIIYRKERKEKTAVASVGARFIAPCFALREGAKPRRCNLKPPFQRGWPPKAGGGLQEKFFRKERKETHRTQKKVASLRAQRSNPENVRNKKIAGLLRFARNDGFLYSREAAKKKSPRLAPFSKGVSAKPTGVC